MYTSSKISSISVLIPDGETWNAVKVLCCLGMAPKVETHILSRDKWAMARFSRYSTKCHYHTSQNDEEWVDAIKGVVRKWGIDVVSPVTKSGLQFLARNRTAISEFAAIPPIADIELIKMARDKWSFHVFAVQHGFPVPASVLVGVPGETSVASKDFDSIEYPALLKPALLDGGFGIVEVKEHSDFDRVWNDERIIKGYRYMLQSYIPGVVMCLAVYSHGGEIVAYALWKTLLTSHRRLYYSARAMEYVSDQRILDISKRLISTMGWDGIANIDFLLDARDGSVNILDFNPQFGQSLLGSLIAGVNFPLLSCLGAMGMEYPSMQQQDAIRYVHPATQSRMLMSRFIGRRLPVKVPWRQGGLQFTVRDPLPELVNACRGILKRLRQRGSAER